MLILRIKICGIQSLEEALWAIESGADALGFIFVPKSKRYLKPSTVQEITEKLPPFVSKVGVFAGESPDRVSKITRQCSLDTIQLHGGEEPMLYDHIQATKLKVISFSSQTNFDDPSLALSLFDKVKALRLRPNTLHGILLDSCHRGQLGGTGVPLPWQTPSFQSVLHQLKQTGIPVIIAGGLTAENVQDALKHTTPYGIDVSSGVERNGRKDPRLIHHFISQARTFHYDLFNPKFKA